MKQAGYAPSTAEKKAYQIVCRPQIQSFLTEALEALGVTAKQLVQPIKDGLEACEVVRTKDGNILTDHPDHRVRLQAHDRAVVLYGLTGKLADKLPAADPEPLAPLNINVVFVKPPDRTSTPETPEVSFVKPGPR